MSPRIKIGNQALNASNSKVEGSFVELEGQDFYAIRRMDQMPPFFMTLVSPFDHWMFISSNGGLTAGRGDAECALFPYYTDDKLVDNAEYTGPKTIIRLKDSQEADSAFLWEPFSDRQKGMYRSERNLYKSLKAEQLIFEEINFDLQLKFSYRWAFSRNYGFIRESILENLSEEEREIECLDGLENMIPPGVDGVMQDGRSTLVDAYKKNELDPETGMGIFSLSSNIVDKAEPSESLSANVVWTADKVSGHLLSSVQLDQFRFGADIQPETFTKAVKSAYFGLRKIGLESKAQKNWYTVADLALSTADVYDLKYKLQEGISEAVLKAEMADAKLEIETLVASADGLQASNEKLVETRHYGNVLYNIMRGGLFEEAYDLDLDDFRNYLALSNKDLAAQFAADLNALKGPMKYSDLIEWVEAKGDADLRRLGAEYLPLSFSRRHGDPSRPWNRFSIKRLDKEGKKILNYEGNWRDIFQNWEALAYSYPRFIEGMIFKFLNASTVDGYNPYRIEKNGIDWEVIEPHDPWSFIGYWGDHQIIYLLRLLEHCENHYPGMLLDWTKEFSFVYADVPYRLKSHQEIVADPQDTILFDEGLNRAAEERFAQVGTDGKLIWQNEAPVRANLAEKLMLTLLTKLYNFVPDGGIWMNTQRPEWNDANNALVGNGLSMVTLCYLRRYMRFMENWLAHQEEDWHINGALLDLYKSVAEVIGAYGDRKVFSAEERMDFVNHMGRAGEQYRQKAYSGDLGASQAIGIVELRDFCARTIRLLDRSIENNALESGIYHAYNLLKVEGSEAKLEYLYEMLEGQVGVLTSETLSPEEALGVLDGLKSSAMFRRDQYSYMLYPDRDLGAFLNKNRIEAAKVASKKLVAHIMECDSKGEYHFKSHINNAKDLKADFEVLSSKGLAAEVAAEEDFWYELYEESFIHRAFTGRSGTFYGYEGLGSIYWHMVSKLLLATQENVIRAKQLNTDEVTLGKLIEHYYEIRAGIGANKSPDLYGAFPFDAYSHTPSTAGAQQPGMTGQVKEDIINRWAELGLKIKGGRLEMDPFFLSEDELLNADRDFRFLNANMEWQNEMIAAGELAFTYCSTLFIYRKGKGTGVELIYHDGSRESNAQLNLSKEQSESLFKREGRIAKVYVDLA